MLTVSNSILSFKKTKTFFALVKRNKKRKKEGAVCTRERRNCNFIVLFLCGGGNKNCIILLLIPVLSQSAEILTAEIILYLGQLDTIYLCLC